MFSSLEINFGIVKADDKRVIIYQTKTQFISINVGLPIKEARWVGIRIVVFLQNGDIRRYKSLSQFEKIG